MSPPTSQRPVRQRRASAILIAAQQDAMADPAPTPKPQRQQQQQPPKPARPPTPPPLLEDDGGDDDACDGPEGEKKTRFVWTPELHRRFEDAVLRLGVAQAKPQAIRQLMGCETEEEPPTRQNIKSHLQKYRLLVQKQVRAPRLTRASHHACTGRPCSPGRYARVRTRTRTRAAVHALRSRGDGPSRHPRQRGGIGVSRAPARTRIAPQRCSHARVSRS